MEKLEDYLYDFIGIFIPGFIFLFSTWVSVVLIVSSDIVEGLVDLFSTKIIFQKDYFINRLVIDNNLFTLAVIIVLSYISGNLFNSISSTCISCIEKINFRRAEKKSKKKSIALSSEDFYQKKMIFSENVKLLKYVKQYLNNQQLIDWGNINPKNLWLTLYRWANLYANKEDYSKLQVLLSKITLIRSLSLVCFFHLLFTIIIFTIEQIFNGFSLYMFIVVFLYCVLVIILILHLIHDFLIKRKILSNEAILVLYKISKDSN
ncbi:MAG: hypothetical protein NAG76_02135 [Candidatus Pristimantibacillus lignocellulolyticus]|uniref:Uncharacterized protein n=1 Tax=Candidatus Pristimantibacillus lignocellulolyticus TaxID=2994561 RepID=A0A9J6ZGT6_9BACL|nr:MAG: hypothetical protein NAG76_02135 [Candidatus Pristimantibacillus lignocellulolyticus]